MEWHIRPATHHDAAAISRVILAALRESNTKDYPPDVIAQIERAFTPEAVAMRLGQRQVLVALQDDTVIGTASLEADVVRSVFMDPAHQKRGIGRQLMEVIHATAARDGVAVLRVQSSVTAERFYAVLGYRKIRDEVNGAERVLVMEKRLQPLASY